MGQPKLKPRLKSPSHSPSLKKSDWDSVKFSLQCTNMESSPVSRRRFILEQYQKTFLKAPPAHQNLELVRLATSYEMYLRELRSRKMPISETLQQNHKAAVSFKPSEFTAPMQALTGIRMNHVNGIKSVTKTEGIPSEPKPKGEETMKRRPIAKIKVKAKTPTVEKKEKVKDSWYQTMRSLAPKATTKKILAEMHSRQPDHKYDDAYARKHVSLYNTGKLGPVGKKLELVEA